MNSVINDFKNKIEELNDNCQCLNQFILNSKYMIYIYNIEKNILKILESQKQSLQTNIIGLRNTLNIVIPKIGYLISRYLL